GIHACRVADLPWWLADELWEIELGGETIARGHKLVAHEGRLIARVVEWSPASAGEFAQACAWRARDRGIQSLRLVGGEKAGAELEACATLADLVSCTRDLVSRVPSARISLAMAGDGGNCALAGAAAASGCIAAQAATRIDGRSGYEAERRWQAAWLRNRLG